MGDQKNPEVWKAVAMQDHFEKIQKLKDKIDGVPNFRRYARWLQVLDWLLPPCLQSCPVQNLHQNGFMVQHFNDKLVHFQQEIYFHR